MEILTAIAKAIGLGDFIAKWIKQNQDEKTGAKLNELHHAQDEKQAVLDAAQIRDGLRADVAYRDRVRDRFTER